MVSCVRVFLNGKLMIVHSLQLLRYLIDDTSFNTWGLCHGCFDLIHWGHIAHIQWAKEHCDFLIVSLTADWAVDKGSGRPLTPQNDRMQVMDGLKNVDFVVPSNAKRGSLMLAALKPNIYFKGPDKERNPGEDLAEEIRIVEGYGGKVMYSPEEPERHSSEILQRFTGIHKDELPR